MLLNAKITGRVQGVGYRYWVLRTAIELNLGGWVRNCVDGSVELQAEGDDDALQELEQRLWKGPAFCRVIEVEAKYSEAKPGHRGFEIAH